jgi:osmotically-inducible protein OsmY
MKINTQKWIICPLVVVALVITMTACNKYQETVPLPTNLNSEVDSEITMKVKAALVENEILRSFHIDAVTTNGDVALTGLVDSQSQIDLATEISRKIKGVHTIHEHMTKP